MGDDAHQSAALRQAGQGAHGLVQGFIAQGAEALVHEHGVQLHAARRGLDLVGEAQGQGQRGKKGLAAGEGLYAALGAIVMVDHVQLQAALAAVVLRLAPALQLILASGHQHEAGICPGQDAVKTGHLDVGFQHDLLFSGNGSVGSVREGFEHGVARFQLFQFRLLGLDVAQRRPVHRQSGVDAPGRILRRFFGAGQLRFAPLLRLLVQIQRLGKLLRQAVHPGVQLPEGFVGDEIGPLGLLERGPLLANLRL